MHDKERLTGVLVQHFELLIGPLMAQLDVDKFNTPDWIGMLRSEPDDRTARVVQPLPLVVLTRVSAAFFAP